MYNLEELLTDKKKFFIAAKETFNVVDRDDSGKISEDEAWIIVCSLADDFGYKRPTFDETVEICKLVGADKSGIITFAEFRKLLYKIFKAVFNDRSAFKADQERREKLMISYDIDADI